MKNLLRSSVLIVAIAATLGARAQAQVQVQVQAQDKAVYHVNDAAAQGIAALRNLRNHLDVSPDTHIVVVTHAQGVDMLMEGAKDEKNKLDYTPLVAALKARGVRFEVCEITLKNRNLKKEQFIQEADFTPSGVARISQLQSRERYGYVKP